MELSNKTKEYFKKEDWEKLDKAQSISEIYDVAKIILSSMQSQLVQICGPITTGEREVLKQI